MKASKIFITLYLGLASVACILLATIFVSSGIFGLLLICFASLIITIAVWQAEVSKFWFRSGMFLVHLVFTLFIIYIVRPSSSEYKYYVFTEAAVAVVFLIICVWLVWKKIKEKDIMLDSENMT